MIHNRSIKEVRRYDIFKLIVLLVLLVFLIIMVLRDESTRSSASDGGDVTTAEGSEDGYPAPGQSAPVPGSDAAYPGDEGPSDPDQVAEGPAYPAPDDSSAPDTAAPDEPEPGYPAPEEGPPAAENAPDDAPYPAPEEAPSADEQPQEGSAYPGPDNGQPAADEQDTSQDQPSELSEGGLALNFPAAGETITAGAATFSGQGQPGSQVIILASGQEIGQATVDDSGNWQIEAEVATGENSLESLMLDPSGNIIASQTIDVQVVADTIPVEPTAEAQPEAGDDIQEPVSPTVNLPGQNVFAYYVVLTGSGSSGEDLLILADEEPQAETTVASDGMWTAELKLAAGTYNIDIAQLDASGEISQLIPGITLPVLPLPGPQLILSEANTPQFDAQEGTFSWQGVAEPGTAIAIIANGENIGSAVAGEEGQWSFESDLVPGQYDVAVATLDDAEQISSESESIALQIDQTPPSIDFQPGLTSQTEDGKTQVNLAAGSVTWNGEAAPQSRVAVLINKEINVTVVTDDNGVWTAEGEIGPDAQNLQIGLIDENGDILLTSKPLPLNVAVNQQLILDPIDVDPDSGNVTVTGTGAPNSTVELVVNGAALTTAVADENGSFTMDIRLGPGTYEISAQTVDTQGEVLISSEVQTIEVAPKIQ